MLEFFCVDSVLQTTSHRIPGSSVAPSFVTSDNAHTTTTQSGPPMGAQLQHQGTQINISILHKINKVFNIFVTLNN